MVWRSLGEFPVERCLGRESRGGIPSREICKGWEVKGLYVLGQVEFSTFMVRFLEVGDITVTNTHLLGLLWKYCNNQGQ